MFAGKHHKEFFALSPLLVGAVFLAVLGVTTVTSVQASTIKACLVQTIDTSLWTLPDGSPAPSPDPAGITVLPNGHLLISDSEVEEFTHPYFHGFNLYEALTSGTLLATANTLAFTKEPTGVAFNPRNSRGHPSLFFSDDDKLRVFEVDLGSDGLYGTADDTVTSFSTSAFGDNDPEGVAFGQGKLFV